MCVCVCVCIYPAVHIFLSVSRFSRGAAHLPSDVTPCKCYPCVGFTRYIYIYGQVCVLIKIYLLNVNFSLFLSGMEPLSCRSTQRKTK